MTIPDWFRAEHQSKSIEKNLPSRTVILNELAVLESEIKNGWGEQKVQQYLKSRPYLLVGKFRSGHGTYAFPENSFGGKYAADWLLASGHSGGFLWELIELECPQSKPFINDGSFSKATRKGIKRIQDWCNWVQNNYGMARKSKAEDGLGLFDIRPRSSGLVVVGQNAKYKTEKGFENFNKHRHDALEQQRIKIESYETFIESLRFIFNKAPYA